MTSVKAIFGGDTRGFEAATAKIGLIAKANAANIATSYKNELVGVQKALSSLPQQSTLAPKLLARESFLKKALGLDKVSVAAIAADATKAAEVAERAATDAAVRQAERNNKARAIRRQRAESRAEREAGMPMLGPSSDAFYKWQIEQAERNNKARALRRERRAEQVERWQDQTAAMRGGMGGFMHGGISGMGGRRASFGAASSMFISAARDSAASLASGAPITQVIAQQAPQVLQALAMMKAGTLAIGVAAVGVAAYGLYKMVSAFKDSYLLTDRIREGLDRIAVMTNDLKNKSDLKLTQQEQELENELKALERKKEQAKFDEDAATAAAEMEKALITKQHLEQNAVRTAKSELDLKEKLLAVELKLALLKATKKPDDRPQELVDAEKELAAARRAQEMYNPEELRQEMYARHAQERPTFGIASNELLKKHRIESANLENEIAIKSGEIFDRVGNARKNLSAVKDRLSGQKTPEQQAADLAVLKIQNEIKELGIKDRRSTTSGGSISAKNGAMIALSEWERAGGRMAGPNIPQDVQKLQLGELKGIGRTLTEIKTRMRGGASF